MFSATNFMANDPGFAWDGMYRGKEVGTRVYLYFAEIEYVDGKKEVLAGDLTILK